MKHIDLEKKIHREEILGECFQLKIQETSKAYHMHYLNKTFQRIIGQNYLPQTEVLIHKRKTYLITQQYENTPLLMDTDVDENLLDFFQY